MRIVLFLLVLTVSAEEVTAPEISAEQQADYFSAQVEQLQADAHMKTAVESMEKTCGNRQVILNDKRRPVCGKK